VGEEEAVDLLAVVAEEGHLKGKAKKEESDKECSLSETESVPPATKINASKRKITGEELISLVKDVDDNVKDYVIQNVFMKQDF